MQLKIERQEGKIGPFWGWVTVGRGMERMKKEEIWLMYFVYMHKNKTLKLF
jgi:hypothetical protein